MLLKEPNYKRKAQRVDLPLLVKVANKVYKTKDWSLLGAGIYDFDLEFEKDKELDCTLILPLQDSSFSIPAKLVLKNARKDITGCEFKDLSEKNRRVLRRYIELAIDGQVDNIEDFIAAHTEPVIKTPIQEALTFEDKEALKIKKKFIKKSIGYIFVGLVVLFVLSYTIFYNLQYKIFSTGVITGSFIKVTANNSGILDKIHVNIHDLVEKNYVLFDIINSTNNHNNYSTHTEIEDLNYQLNYFSKPLNRNLLNDLKLRFEIKRKQFENAKILYKNRLITNKDYNFIYDTFINAKISYERELERIRSESAKYKAKNDSIKIKMASIRKQQKNNQEVSAFQRRLSPAEGIIYRIEHNKGEFVHPDDIVMVLQTRSNPFVILKLHSRDIYKIKINDHAKIYSKYSERVYSGKVTQIGYVSVNADSTISHETSLNESLVKIEFIDPVVDFPLNSRVEVRIKRDFLKWS